MIIHENKHVTTTSAKKISRPGYIFLLVLLIIVFEGMARKWISASSTLPLIFARDALAVYLIFYAWKWGYLKRQKNITNALLAWSCCFLIWGMMQIILGESSPLVLVLGVRFWLLYVWFGCAAAATMTETDYRTAVLMTVALLLALAPLAVLQFYSPPSSFINRELGDGDESPFLLIAGIVRPNSTFTFTLGYTTFLSLVAPFVFAVVEARKKLTKHYLFSFLIFICFIVGSVVSGSRSAIIYSATLFTIYLVGKLFLSKWKKKGRVLLSIVGAIILVILLIYIFQGAVDATHQRFEQASESEAFWVRFFTIFIGEPAIYERLSWLGSGFGLGSNLASYVETGGRSFLLTETEAGRILLEGGLMGFVWIAIKLLVIGFGLFQSWRLSLRFRVIFPFLVWVTVAFALLGWSSIGQITANGLLGIMIALGLATLRYPNIQLFSKSAQPT